MRFFVSYSRSIHHDVQPIVNLLRAADHEVWWDGDIPVIADWWATILDHIEWCQVFVFMVSEKAVKSPYCLGELQYATDLNCPVLPFLMDDETRYTIPPEVTPMRNQWFKHTGDPAHMLERIIKSSESLNWGQYVRMPTSRPVEPNSGSGSLIEEFQQAVDLAEDGHFAEAIKHFRNVASLDNPEWGEDCRTWIARLQVYDPITKLAGHKATQARARRSWLAYVEEYGADYDPFDLAEQLRPKPKTTPKPEEPTSSLPPGVVDLSPLIGGHARDLAVNWDLSEVAGIRGGTPSEERSVEHRGTPKKKTPSTPQSDSPLRAGEGPGVRSVTDILPPPFVWIDIPGGEVTLEAGGYVPKGGQTFTVEPFAIAKYPVTNAQFRVFWEAKGYDNPDWWTDEGWGIREEEGWIEPRYWQEEEWNQPDLPVVGVSWFEAVAFCLWLRDITGEEITLPTEQQWQRAAQGDDGRKYPWGNPWDISRCNNNVDRRGIGKTTPVTHYEGRDKGDSFFSVVDMAGNVWEWCITNYETGGQEFNSATERRLLRGGSWVNDYDFFFRVGYRGKRGPIRGNMDWGFRFARLP